jgi:hypothetical protein
VSPLAIRFVPPISSFFFETDLVRWLMIACDDSLLVACSLWLVAGGWWLLLVSSVVSSVQSMHNIEHIEHDV